MTAPSRNLTHRLEAVFKGLFWRVVRPCYVGVVTTAARLLNRLSHRLVKALEVVAWDVVDALRRGRCSRAITVPFHVRGVSFKLSLVENHVGAHTHYARIASGGDYESVMVECLKRLLGRLSAPDFIDIGAFMGYYACFVSALLQDRTPTYAIESNPRYCRAIEHSARLNGFTRLTTYNVALSDTVQTVRIQGETVRFDAQGQAVTSLTLDELCQREGIRPKIVKIDVHGGEGKVLLGMQRLMQDSLEFILMELHPLCYLLRYSPGISRKGILALLERHGFHAFYVAGHRYQRTEGLQWFLETGRFAYCRLTEETRDWLLFDRHVDIFVLASRTPDLEPLLGPSTIDPGLADGELPAELARRIAAQAA